MIMTLSARTQVTAVLLALVLGVGCCATAPEAGQTRDANGTAKACTCKQCSGCDGSCCN
jgi:hypothetical protein